MFDFIHLPEVPSSVENTLQNFTARFHVINSLYDTDYNIAGIFYVAKLEVVPAGTRRVWSPTLRELFRTEERIVSEEIGTRKIEEHSSDLTVITQNVEQVVSEVNLYFARQYNLIVPEKKFVELINPIVRQYTEVKALRLKGRPSHLKITEREEL